MSTEKSFNARRIWGATAGGVAAFCLWAAPAMGRTLYVAPGGAGASCSKKAPCKTIDAAVTKAKAGDRIKVGRGVYREQVTIEEKLSIIGVGKPTIEAEGQENGVKIAGPKAAGSKVQGFVVEHASFEGILALSTAKVTIKDNVVRNNDEGMNASKLEGECAPQGPVPGDCGEGLHLMGTSNSKVMNNRVTGNAGGILLTDEVGPAAHNTIAHNAVLRNIYDCGITLAGHSTEAVSSEGKPQPSKAGVFDNRVIGNVSNGNGVKGEGAGILMAAGAPGSGVYGNIVKDNTANGNGLAGVTIHSHAPGQDLNGNEIVSNRLSNDAISGNKGQPGDEDAEVTGTTGILIFSAVTPLKGIVVKGNKISNVHYGIWTKNAPKMNVKANKFTKVEVPLTQL